MTTAIDICNAALAELEEAPIAGFVDGTEAARQCAANFFVCARAVLREFAWNSATARAKLPALLDAPAYGWKRGFRLPTDCLFVRLVDDNERSDDWRVEGRVILTDLVAPLSILYTRDLTLDPLTGTEVTGGERLSIDALCVDAMAFRLAARLAKRITGSDTTAREMWDKFVDAMRRARSVDAMEGRASVFESAEWADVEGNPLGLPTAYPY